MRRLLPWLLAAVAAFAVPTGAAAAVSPRVRLTIVHVVQGCHSWGTADSEATAPAQRLTVRRGTRLEIRVNCPMDFVFSQTRGPKLPLGDPLTHSGTVRTVVFRKAGLYRLRAVSPKSSEESGLQTLGPDNVLVLTVVVR